MNEFRLICSFLEKLQIKVMKAFPYLFIMLLNSLSEVVFFLVDFIDFLVEKRLEEERMLANSHNFNVAFNHFDCTFMTVQSVSVLFLLKGCLFKFMVHTNSFINVLLFKILFNHLLRKHNIMIFFDTGMRLFCFEMLFISAERGQSIRKHMLTWMLLISHVVDSIFLLSHNLGYSFLKANVVMESFLVLTKG